MRREDASFFDATAECSIVQRRLPHWGQSGAFSFVTFRLADSFPADVAAEWRQQRAALLQQAGIDPRSHLRRAIARLPRRQAELLRWKLFQAWDDQLDGLHGSCHLRDRRASQVVADGLLRFDGDRYVMAAFAVMPNHVHLLAAFDDPDAVTAQGAQWRQYFARQINPMLRRSGHLWQVDQFDHLIRSEASFERIRRYIIDNPLKARLQGGEYRLYFSASW